MSVTIASIEFWADWPFPRDTAFDVRATSTQSWVTVDGVLVNSNASRVVGTGSIASLRPTIPQITLPATSAGVDNQSARWTVTLHRTGKTDALFTVLDNFPLNVGFEPVATWGEIKLFKNNGDNKIWRDTEGFSRTDALNFFNERVNVGGAATTTSLGRLKTRTAPADAASPKAIIEGDPLLPTQGESDAAQGTHGTPSNSNRYVTDSDPRLLKGTYARASLPATDVQAGTLAVVSDNLRGLWVYTAYGWRSLTGEANVVDFGASGAKSTSGISATTTTTSGSTAAGATSVTVASGSSFSNGDVIKITGAGPSGAIYRGLLVSGGGGTSWTIYPATHTLVSSGALVEHGDPNVTTKTSGAVLAGATTIPVAEVSTFYAGQGVYIAGAGASSGGGFLPFIGTIQSVSATSGAGNIVLTGGITTGVSANALVMHDDTAAIRAAMAAAAGNYGAKVEFPHGPDFGLYMVNGSLLTSGGGRQGVLLLPESLGGADTCQSLILEGSGPRATLIQPSFITHETTTRGAIIQSDTPSGAIISGSTSYPGFAFTMIDLTVRHLHFRLYNNPQAMGLDLYNVNAATIDHVNVDCGVQSAGLTQPSSTNAIAINTPGPGNGGQTYVRDVVVGAGFNDGIPMGEHTDISETLIIGCLNGLSIRNGETVDYPIKIGRVTTNQCAVPFRNRGTARIHGGLLEAERNFVGSNFPSWLDHVADVVDASDGLSGNLSVFSWLPPSSSVSPTRTGARGLLMRHVDAPWAPEIHLRNSQNIAVANATDVPITFDTEDLDTDGQHVSKTVTADAATDVLTSASHGLTDGEAVRFTTTTTLPAGLTAGTAYYVRDVTTNTFKVSATSGGAAVNITDAGTGTHTVHGSRIYAAGLGGVSLGGNVQFAATPTANAALTVFIRKINPGDGNSPYYIQSETFRPAVDSAGNPSATNVSISVDSTINSSTQCFELWVSQDSGGSLNVVATAGPSVIYSPTFRMTYR